MDRKNRQSNIELLRIVAMFMIVSGHLVTHGVEQRTLENAYEFYRNGTLINRICANILTPGGGIGVGIFFIITGYFLVLKERPHFKKVLLELVFYGWFTLIAFAVIKVIGLGNTFGSADIRSLLINAVSPAANGIWWFATAYVLVILTSPILNSLLQRVNRRGRVSVLIISWFILMFVGAFSGTAYSNFYRGIFFYLVGGAVRLKSEQKDIGQKKNKSRVAMYIVLAAITWILSSAIEFLIVEYERMTSVLSLFSYAVTTPICALAVFEVFSRLHVKQSKAINRIAATTFGIYLLHDSFISRIVVWEDIFHIGAVVYQSRIFLLLAIVIAIAVFAICSMIDEMRIIFFEPGILKIVERIERKIITPE